MSLSTAEIAAVVRDLKPRLEGGRIERIDQPKPDRLILSILRGPARYWLMLCAHRRFSRLHLLTRRPDEGPPADGFCNLVRQHCTDVPISELRQVPGDRVVTIECVARDRLMQPRPLKLVAELIGVGSNLILLDESDMVLGALHREDSARRKVVPGEQFSPLPPPANPPPRAKLNRFEEATGSAEALELSRAIMAHYAPLEAERHQELRREEVLAALEADLDRAERRLQHITAELERAQSAEDIRRRGELLKIALPQVETGQREVRVKDYFEPERGEVVIELDPALSPERNLESIFRTYKKAKSGAARLESRRKSTERHIAGLRELIGIARSAETAQKLRAVKDRARKGGVLFPEDRQSTDTAERSTGPRRFLSTDGLQILVARNARQNDKLTFTIANGNDYWMHLLGWAGPHVVIRVPPDGAVPRSSLVDAAHLAVHFSKIRGADYAQVAYTRCKHVRRLKGSGRVSYADANTLQVRTSRGRLRRLLGSAGQGDEGR